MSEHERLPLKVDQTRVTDYGPQGLPAMPEQFLKPTIEDQWKMEKPIQLPPRNISGIAALTDHELKHIAGKVRTATEIEAAMKEKETAGREMEAEIRKANAEFMSKTIAKIAKNSTYGVFASKGWKTVKPKEVISLPKLKAALLIAIREELGESVAESPLIKRIFERVGI